MFVVLLTFDKTGDTHTPCICYIRKDPALFMTLPQAQDYAKELGEYNPGSVYEVYQLMEVV